MFLFGSVTSPSQFADIVVDAASQNRRLKRQTQLRKLRQQHAAIDAEVDADPPPSDERTFELLAQLQKVRLAEKKISLPDPRDAPGFSIAARGGLRALHVAINKAIDSGQVRYCEAPMPSGMIPSKTDCLWRPLDQLWRNPLHYAVVAVPGSAHSTLPCCCNALVIRTLLEASPAAAEVRLRAVQHGV
jgi:hypothetical protein